MASRRQGRPHKAPAQENSADFMDTMQEMAHAMWEQASTAHQMMDQLGRWPEVSHGGNLHGPENPHGLVSKERMTLIRLMNGSRP